MSASESHFELRYSLMLCLQELRAATSETIRTELGRTIEQLLTLLNRDTDVLGDMQALRNLLTSLPLAADEHGVVSKRLCNAHRYLVSQELGAARYELRILAGSFCCGHPIERLPPPEPFTGLRSLGQEYLPKHVDEERPDSRHPTFRPMG